MKSKKEVENIQNILSVEYRGKKILSKPFDFEAACLIDDAVFSGEGKSGLMNLGKKAVNYMFRETELTDEVIENELDVLERKRLCEEAAFMYFKTFTKKDGDAPKNAERTEETPSD